MSQYQSYIPNYLGGISTIPTSSRNPNEVSDAENVLFSNARGAYKRPGTRRLVSNLNRWNIRAEDGVLEVFPVGDQVLQTVIVQNGKASVFWINTDQAEVAEFAEHYKSLRDKGEVQVSEGRVAEGRSNIQNAQNKLDRKGFYFRKEVGGGTRSDILEDPQNPNFRPDEPILITDNNPYLATTNRPEQTFRITRNQSRLFILNRDQEAGLLGQTFPGNEELFRNHWTLYFVASTSGQDVVVTIRWESNGGKVEQVLELGQIGIETAGEELLSAWNKIVGGPPSGISIRAKGQVATVRITDTALISNLSFEYSNMAVVELSEEDNIRSVPSFAALPPTAPNNMVVQVSGSAVTRLDDVWVRFEEVKEEE